MTTATEGDLKRRYAFLLRRDQRHVLPNSLIVFPWRFYWLTEAELRGCPIPYVEVPEDSSRVGTRLKRIFGAFGFRGGGCNCEGTREILDAAGLDFIQDHVEEAVGFVLTNAAALKIKVPRAVVRRVVQAAIALERRKMKAGRQ